MKKNIIVVCLLATVLTGCEAEKEKITEQNVEVVTLSPTLNKETLQEQTSQGKYEDIIELPEEIQDILYGVGSFYDVESGKEYNKETYKLSDYEGVMQKNQWGRYLVYDIDGDGEKELAVIMQDDYDGAFKEVFDRQEDRVYAYKFRYRGFQMVYTDGAVMQSSGADINSFVTMKFDKNKYEETIIAESTAEENEEGDYVSVWYIGEKKVTEEEFYEFISRYHNEEVKIPWSTSTIDEIIKK